MPKKKKKKGSSKGKGVANASLPQEAAHPIPLSVLSSIVNAPLIPQPQRSSTVNLFRNPQSYAQPSVTVPLTIPDINQRLRQFYGSLAIRRLFYSDIPIAIKDYVSLSIVPGQDYQTRLTEFAKVSGEKQYEEIYEYNTRLYVSFR